MSTFSDARLRKLNSQAVRPRGDYVLYWPQMSRRLTCNHALDYALQIAKHFKKPLVVFEGLKLNYPWANARFHTFILEGMADTAATANRLGITYWPWVETPGDAGRGLVRKLAENAVLLVTDDYPAFIVPAHNRAVARLSVAVHAVDSNGVVPLSLLGKSVGAANHLRPRLHKLFSQGWEHRANAEPDLTGVPKLNRDAPFATWKPPSDLRAFVATLPIDQTVKPVAAVGGSTAGAKLLTGFVRQKLTKYDSERNLPGDPEGNSASGLSAHLHYGHISIEQVIGETLATVGGWSDQLLNLKTRNKDDFFCRDANVNSFLDEAITWRDVGYHWHFNRTLACDATAPSVSWHSTDDPPSFNFETMDFSPVSGSTLATVLPPWAHASLMKHASDPREFTYTLEEFESAETHDELWNAAQVELVRTGRIHNYLRMLWGKKVLEWSPSPEEAYRTLEHLNNKYAIDGRDPNSYTGILWCFGLFDRPWPPERPVFGNIRFMSSVNTAKKFDLKGYYRYIRRLSSTP